MDTPDQSENTSYPTLFSPFRLTTLTLRNRSVVAPMTRISATADGRATEQMVRYYAGFAEGGFALVETEGVYTDTRYSQCYEDQPGLATDAQARSWRPVVDAVHAAGGAIVAQLMHAGALSQYNRYESEVVAPSVVPPLGRPMPFYGGREQFLTPRAMTGQDLSEALKGFVDAARRAQEAGFDGVEIHGANGYLLDQFLTDYTNRRTDAYGGDLAARLRFVTETVAAVRAAVGADFTVGIRLSQTKANDTEHRWAEGEAGARYIFRGLVDAGADFLHICGAPAEQPAFDDEGPTLAALAKRYGECPVIANGGLELPDRAEALLAAGTADLIALGKGALANPDWPRRVAAEQPIAPMDFAMLAPRATLDNSERWQHRQGERACIIGTG